MPVAVATTDRMPRVPAHNVDYCRQARRLRCQLAGQPHRMHDELKSLSRRHDRICAKAKLDPDRVRVRVAATVVQPKQVSGATLFAEQVENAMDGGVLRYSMRMELLKAADRAKLGRFEANLIIAAVQHRRGEVDEESKEEKSRSKDSPWSRWLPLAATLGAVQAMIVAAAMWAWHV